MQPVFPFQWLFPGPWDHLLPACSFYKKMFAQNKFKIYLPSRSLFFSSHMIVSFLPLQKVFFVCCGRAATVCGGKRRLLLHVFLVKQPTWPKPTFLGCCRGCGCAIAAVEGRRVPLRAGWSQNIPVEQTSQCYSVSQRGQTRCHCRWEACVWPVTVIEEKLKRPSKEFQGAAESVLIVTISASRQIDLL